MPSLHRQPAGVAGDSHDLEDHPDEHHRPQRDAEAAAGRHQERAEGAADREDGERKLHDAARLLAEGAPEQGVSRQVKLWGPSAAPTLKAARTLGPRRAAQLFDEAIDLDRRSKSGLAGELPRTLEAFVTSFSAALAPRTARSAPTTTR